MKEYYPYINNKKIQGEKSLVIKAASNGKPLGKMYTLNKEELEQCFGLSHNTFSIWKNSTSELRIRILNQWIHNLETNKNEIIELMSNEIAKNIKSCTSEINRAIESIKQTIHAYYQFHPQAFSGKQVDKNTIGYFNRKPLGVILCISPFNYPVNLFITKVAPAIITGNTVIIKSASQGMLTSSLISKALINTDIPKGVFNFVAGKGSEIGDALVSNKYIKLINFTGSTSVGTQIPKKAHFAKFILELGGKGTAVVLSDADIKVAAKNIVQGAFSFNGQRCTAIKRVIVEKSISKKLIRELVFYVKKLTIGMPCDNCDITPMIDRDSWEYAVALLDEALINKCEAEIGNKVEKDKNIIYPTILSNVKQTERIFIEEQFAPILPIHTIEDDNHGQIIKIINDSEYGLQSCIFTLNIKKAIKISQELETGSVHINKFQERGPEYIPFMGVKNSGLGVQGSLETLKLYTNLHGIIINY